MHLFQSIHQHAWHLLPKIQIIISVVTARADQNVGCQASLLNFGGIFFLQEIQTDGFATSTLFREHYERIFLQIPPDLF